MPETPKVFRKKSKVKTWFNGLAREVLTGEDWPVRRLSEATAGSVATFQGYPSLPSDDSESEGEMEGPSHPVLDGNEATISAITSAISENSRGIGEYKTEGARAIIRSDMARVSYARNSRSHRKSNRDPGEGQSGRCSAGVPDVPEVREGSWERKYASYEGSEQGRV